MDSAPLTRRERLEARETAIIEAARSLFLEHGHQGTTVSEIARRADLAEGTLYLYFRNKQAIMEAVVADHWASLTRGAAAAIEGVHDNLGQLAALARFHLAALIEKWPLLELSLARRVADPDDAIPYEVNFKRAYVATFDQVFARAQDRGDIDAGVALWMARDFFYGTLEYAARSIMLDERRRDDEAVVAFVMHMTGAGLQTRPGAGLTTAGDDLDALTKNLEAVTSELKAYRARVASASS